MKKVFDSFYVFSKFSLSFILLLCVFFLIYLLYTNYQNEDEVSKLQIELENELRENINENSEFIKNISKEILETKTALTNIEKLIKENSNKESKVDLTSINESIELLNKNFNSLSYEISSIKNKNIEDQPNNNPKLVITCPRCAIIFTIGKIIGGSVGGASDSAGAKRATKSEMFRINSSGQIITNGSSANAPYPTRGLTIQPAASQTNNYVSIIAGNTSSVSGVTFGTSADNDANNYRAMFEYYHSGFAHNEGLRFLALGTEKFRIRGGSSNAGDILYGSGDHVIGASPGLLNGLGSHNNANPASVMYGIDDGGGYNGMKVINFDDGTFNSQKIEFLTGKGGVSMATVRMAIDENGLVGINSTTPDKRLTITTSNEDALLIKNTNTAQYNSARIHLQSMGSATDNITAFVHGNDNTGGSNSYFAIESKNSSHSYIKTLMLYKHNGDYWDINAGASGSASVRVLDKVLNVGGNFTQTTAPFSVTTDANDYGIRLLTGSNVVFDAMTNGTAGNCELRGYYNSNSGTHGLGFRIEANGETYFSISIFRRYKSISIH